MVKVNLITLIVSMLTLFIAHSQEKQFETVYEDAKRRVDVFSKYPIILSDKVPTLQDKWLRHEYSISGELKDEKLDELLPSKLKQKIPVILYVSFDLDSVLSVVTDYEFLQFKEICEVNEGPNRKANWAFLRLSKLLIINQNTPYYHVCKNGIMEKVTLEEYPSLREDGVYSVINVEEIIKRTFDKLTEQFFSTSRYTYFLHIKGHREDNGTGIVPFKAYDYSKVEELEDEIATMPAYKIEAYKTIEKHTDFMFRGRIFLSSDPVSYSYKIALMREGKNRSRKELEAFLKNVDGLKESIIERGKSINMIGDLNFLKSHCGYELSYPGVLTDNNPVQESLSFVYFDLVNLASSSYHLYQKNASKWVNLNEYTNFTQYSLYNSSSFSTINWNELYQDSEGKTSILYKMLFNKLSKVKNYRAIEKQWSVRPFFSHGSPLKNRDFEDTEKTVYVERLDKGLNSRFSMNNRPAIIYYVVNTDEHFMRNAVDYELRLLKKTCNEKLKANWIAFVNSHYTKGDSRGLAREYLICKNGFFSVKQYPESVVKSLEDKRVLLREANTSKTEDTKGLLTYHLDYKKYIYPETEEKGVSENKHDLGEAFFKYPFVYPDFIFANLDLALKHFPSNGYAHILHIKSHGSINNVMIPLLPPQIAKKDQSLREYMDERGANLPKIKQEEIGIHSIGDFDIWEKELEKVNLSSVDPDFSLSADNGNNFNYTDLFKLPEHMGVDNIGGLNGQGDFGLAQPYLDKVILDVLSKHSYDGQLITTIVESCMSNISYDNYYKLTHSNMLYSANGVLWYRNINWFDLLSKSEGDLRKLGEMLRDLLSSIKVYDASVSNRSLNLPSENIKLSFRAPKGRDPFKGVDMHPNTRHLQIALAREVTFWNRLRDLVNTTILLVNDSYNVDLSFLESMPLIHLLVLRGSTLKNSQAISYLSNLEYLDIAFTNIEDISFLRKNKKLTEFHAIGVQLGSVDYLSNLKELRGLDLKRTQIKNLLPLVKNTNLKELKVGGNNIGNASMIEYLSNLKSDRLEELSIEQNNLDDSIIEEMLNNKQLKNLEDLSLSVDVDSDRTKENSFTCDTLKKLGNSEVLRKLRRVHVRQTHLACLCNNVSSCDFGKVSFLDNYYY
jgi:hypothetical protein